MEMFNRINLKDTYSFNVEAENRAYLHNILIDEMEAYLGVVFNEVAPIEHIQKQAYLKGRIDLLQQLLNKEI